MSASGDLVDRTSMEVLALNGLNVDRLRTEWLRRFASPPPALRGPDLMRRAIANAIQTEALGRDVELEKRIARLVRGLQRGEKVKAPKPMFRSGTVLVREHQGRTHRVEVRDEGFRYEGRTTTASRISPARSPACAGTAPASSACAKGEVTPMSRSHKAIVGAPSRLRCAIYTRKSSEEGLEQDFNSLHAQREACEAYVRSQAGEGWPTLPAAYDDGGFSGGTLDRPGLEAAAGRCRRAAGSTWWWSTRSIA